MKHPQRKNDSWSEKELSTLDSLLPDSEVARLTGRSEAAIRGKRQRLGLASKRPTAETTFEQDAEAARSGYWRDRFSTLQGKYQRLLKQTTANEQLVALASELAPKSYETGAKAVHTPTSKGQPQSAVLLLSDTHVGQVIDPDQTLGFGKYDFPTFLARLKFYEDAVISILRDHTTTPLTELVVCLGGDMIHGALNHSAEAAQHNTLFQQFYGAGHAIAQFLRNLNAYAPKVRVYCTVGNHPRWGTQKKMPTDNRYSNLDQFLYAYVQALTRDIPTLHWNLDTQPVALFDVQGFRFHLSHGDSLRGGDKALGIPNHAVGRMVSSNSQLFGKREEPAPNYYLLGHLHRGIVLPHSRGSVIVNGGFPGVDGFGLAGGFSAVDPKQVFFLVHPKYGKTATYDIELKFAEVGETPAYVVPTGFNLQ